MVLINEMRKNHGSNAISYLPKVGREGALSTEGGWAGKGTVGREGDRIESGEHRGSSGQIGGW